MKKILVFCLVLTFFMSCGGNGKNESQDEHGGSAVNNSEQPLNLIILLDLSDRITDKKNPLIPTHVQRDSAIVSYLTTIFKKEVKKEKDVKKANGCMQVLFFPQPNNPNIANLSQKLAVNLKDKTQNQKRDIFANIENDFANSLSEIYAHTIRNSEWLGANIWEFFKDKIDLYLEPAYRNVVVVITDGYLVSTTNNCLPPQNHRHSCLGETFFTNEGLRNPSTYMSQIQNNDVGLIAKRDDLNNVEILFLELEPYPKYPTDFDVMKIILKKWCMEMGVAEKNVSIYPTDLPINTQKAIDKFLNK